MIVTTADRLLTTQEYYFSKKLREIDELNKQGKKVINLGIGSPDLPPHPTVVEALKVYADKTTSHAYQNYKGVPALREAIAFWYNRYYDVKADPKTEILPLMGSKEGIMHICMTYLQAGDEALIPNPGYPTYSSAVQLSGAKGVHYDLIEENDWFPDLDALERQDLSKVKLMWINYPHMPTGAVATPDSLSSLIRFAQRNEILLCHDNPYSFILTEEPVSLLKYDPQKNVVMELNSLSKSSNMAGWRIGMLIANERRVNEILKFKTNMDSGMFLPVQMAAVEALNLDKSWYADLNAIYAARRQRVYDLLDELGCVYDRQQAGMFIWAKIPSSYSDCYTLSDAILLQASVFITPGSIFGSAGNQYIRVSLCTKEEILLEAIQRIRHAKLIIEEEKQ